MPLRSNLQDRAFLPADSDWWWNDCFLIRRHLAAAVRAAAPKLEGPILDFGCGSKPYLPYFEGKSYLGIDLAASGHDHAESQIDVYYDGHTLALPDARFNAVVSTEVLEHLFNYDEILSELWRVLRPNGRLFLTTPFIWPEHEQPYDCARHTSFGLKALLEKHGFTEVSIEKRGHSVEAVCQLALFYARDQLMPRPGRLNRWMGVFWCSAFNLCALAGARMLPTSPDLYLSNIATAVKPANPG